MSDVTAGADDTLTAAPVAAAPPVPSAVVHSHPVIERLDGDEWLPAFSAMPPGPELAAVLAVLDPTLVLGADDLLEMITGYERLAAWVGGRQLAAIAEFARRPWGLVTDAAASFAGRGAAGSVTREAVDSEVASALTISRMSAAGKIGGAAQLVSRMPATVAALEAGQIDVSRARMMAELCAPLDPAATLLVEQAVLPKAATHTWGPLKKAVLREVAAADPAAAQQRAVTQNRERRVVVTPTGNGMATLWAYLPLVVAAAIDTAISAVARTMKANYAAERAAGLVPSKSADGRGGQLMDQLRADALGAPFLHALATGALADTNNTRLGRQRGEPVMLHVTVPATVLLGTSDDPGDVAGYGPITAQTVRELEPRSRMRRLLTDPKDGTLLDVGTTIYRPPAALARHVRLRDGTCVLPICNRPAVACDLDHTIPASSDPTASGDDPAAGGATADYNLGPFCERHHLYKHALANCQPLPDGRQPGVTQPAPGVFRWILPTGHEYTTKPQAIAPPITEKLRT